MKKTLDLELALNNTMKRLNIKRGRNYETQGFL